MRSMNHSPRFTNLLQLAAIVLISSAVASAATAVGTCRPDLSSYATFAAAIAGTPDGGTINVCPGNYAEQFTITKNLTIQGIQSGNSALPAIVPPAGGLVQNIVSYGGTISSGFLYNTPLAAQVIVAPGLNVTIRNLSVDATGNNIYCGPVIVGIYFEDSSGTVNHVAFRNQANVCYFNGFAGYTNYPSGDGVLIESNSNSANVSVLNSSFHNPGWMAMHAVGAAASLTAKNNTAVGPGVTYGNGILVEGGAAAPYITNNSESNALINGANTGYWGILLNGCSGGSVVSNNTLSNTQIGIYVTCANNSVTGNWIFNSQLDGVTVCGNGNTVQSNFINDSGRSAINLAQGCASANNITSYNTIDGACTAVLSGTDATGNTSTPNTVFNAKYLNVNGSTCN